MREKNMENLSKKKEGHERLLWMDVLRGLLILSVVVGHATGRFNGYIYQFHMGAFFLVSGYMAHQERRSILHTLYHRLLTAVLPVLTAVFVLLAVMAALNATGTYSVLFGEDLSYMGAAFILKQFLLNGSLYVWWLGAAWFILALFGASVLNRILFQLCGKRSSVLYLVGLIALFLLGYAKASSGPVWHDLDLVLIASFYYGLGSMAADALTLERLSQKKAVCAMGLVVTSGLLFFVAHRFGWTMDWPSRRFNSPIIDCFTVLNGLGFVFFLSTFLKTLPGVRQILSYLGKNTLPIVLFHFIWFNLGYYLLYLAGVVPFSYLQNFIPQEDISYTWWWLFVLVGVGGSVLVWKIVQRWRPLRILFGQEKALYERWWNQLICHRRVQAVDETLERGLNWIGCERVRRVKSAVKRHPLTVLLLGLFLLTALIPWYREGIILNDELRQRFAAYQGMSTYLTATFHGCLNQGRVLAAPVQTALLWLNFIGQSNWTFKITQILIILLTVFAFCALIDRIFAKRSFSLLCGIALVAFLPVTFEHTMPNAFVAIFPVGLLFVSMSLYWDWLVTRRTGKLLGSILTLVITLCSYEAFVTFVPVYVLLAVWQRGIKETLHRWRDLLWPVITGVVYVAAYVVSGKLFPSQYAGNQLILPNPLNALKIMLHLMCTSLPGYYLTNKKYQYLFTVYQNITLDDVVRLVLVCCTFAGLMLLLFRGRSREGQLKHIGWVILGALVCMALPTVPIAMAEMYQTAIGGDNGFLALPVTFFAYFPGILLCCLLCWQLCCAVPHKATPWVIALCMLMVLAPTQLMSEEFAQRQDENFDRLETMEAYVKSPIMQNMGSATVCTTDLFQTRDALGIHDSYWTDYAAASGETVQVVNQEGTATDHRLYFDDTRFYLWAGDQLCVASKEPLTGYGAVPYLADTYYPVHYDQSYGYGEWYVCLFSYTDGTLKPSTMESFSQAQQQVSIGQTLATCLPLEGYNSDGWLAKNSRFQIFSGETGTLQFTFYQPHEEYQAMSGIITVNGEVHPFTLTGANTELELSVVPSSLLEVSISMEQEFEGGNGDQRMLSVLLSNMEGR